VAGEAEQQRQQRRHERTPADAGQTDQETYQQTGNGIGKGHRGILELPGFPLVRVTYTGWALDAIRAGERLTKFENRNKLASYLKLIRSCLFIRTQLYEPSPVPLRA
jgi:hypothetical protein